MKKLVAVILLACLLFGSAVAEGITWHSVFGLSKDATLEEMTNAIKKTFSADPYGDDKTRFYPDYQYFYGLPVRWVIIRADDFSGFSTRSIEVGLEDESLTAENFITLYNKLCGEFGNATVCNLTRDIVTVNGKEKEPLFLEDPEGIQLAIDQCSARGLVCWDNVSLYFWSYVSSYDSKQEIIFYFTVALSEDSLEREVRELYGIS